MAAEVLASQGGEDVTAKVLASLSEVSEQARAAGLGEIPPLASELSEAVHSGEGKEGLLLQGIDRLHQAIDRGRQEAPKAEPGGQSQPALARISADPEILAEFLVESRDHLASIESHLLTLERDAGNTEAIHATFRGFHTMKGLAGFLEFPAIQKVAHEVESLLDKVRSGQLSITPTLVDVVLESADYLRTDVARIERAAQGEAVPKPADNEPLLVRIQAQLTGNKKVPSEAVIGETAIAPPKTDAAPNQTAEHEAKPEETKKEIKPEETRPEAKPEETKKSSSPESRFVKVDTSKLDFLVDMVGELVIAQSMIHHDGQLSSISNPKLQRNLSQLGRITGEVQKTAMSMRMVPIGQLFQRSVRLIRDLTRKSGKKAELVLTGEDTELDRTIVEDLADPLIHMIRNAADHGVEPPHERVQAGKHPVAKIGLKAYHQAGHIVIEVSDDGRGLNREKILEKARQRGLIQDSHQLTDNEVFNLIFEPGFSTAEHVTDVSGRGVGMDVVRKQIQKMRGRVDINSEPGKGTTFYLKLPLTLAIIEGLVVAVAKERYIVPIYVVKEMFRPTPASVFTVVNRREMVLVRDKLLPVVRLYQRFGVEPRSTDITQSLLIVAECGSKRFCLAVDDLIGKQEVVIKTLGDTFKSISSVAGGAILGDGRVGLILEMDGLFTESAHG